MSVKNYAIIDHAGSVGACKALYKRAFDTAKEFEKVYTLKAVCKAYSPYAKEITNKMKYFHRYNRTPKKVYIVCASQFDPKAQFIASIWENRDIPVSFIEENQAPVTHIETVSKARRCALIWGSALGWSFSAPLFRDPYTESIDMYTKRPARPDGSTETGSYAAKRTTNPNNYIESFRAVAPEAECIAFMEQYAYYYKNGILAECLEPGWKLCPTCGRPVRETADHCQWCETELEAVEIDTFWDDSYQDEQISE